MKVKLSKTLVEKWVTEYALQNHYDDHVMKFPNIEKENYPEEFYGNDVLDYLPIRSYDDIPPQPSKTLQNIIGDEIEFDFEYQKQDDPKYPKHPYMNIMDYDGYAEDLANAQANEYGSGGNIIGWITYNISKQTLRKRPRIVKVRWHSPVRLYNGDKIDDQFGEIVVTNMDGEIVSYSLFDKSSGKIEREYNDRAVYTLGGKPIHTKKNANTFDMLLKDKESMYQIGKYCKNKNDDIESSEINESYSQPSPITDRYSRVIGYIQTDNTTGDQMLTDRFSRVLGWYKSRSNITMDRYSRIVGFGNILTSLLDREK